jgi:site-specific recombinase XerD
MIGTELLPASSPAVVGETVPVETITADLSSRAGYTAVTEAWLANRRLSEHTRAAYRRDVDDYLDWCARAGVDPATARFTHTNAYARHLEALPHARHPDRAWYTASSVARKLSGLASWYGFLVKLQAVAHNPLDGTDRPVVDRDYSSTTGLTVEQVDQLLAAIEAPRPGSDTRARDRAVVTLLADLGLRVSEVCGLDVDDLGHDRDHRTVRFVGKGGRHRRRSLDPGAAAAVDRYLDARAAAAEVPRDQLTGPLFVTDTGRRLDRHAVAALIRSLAHRAELPSADRITPHSLRHAFATAAREANVALEDVQDAMGHADPRTTRRYDRDRESLDRDPSYRVWQLRVERRRKPAEHGTAA